MCRTLGIALSNNGAIFYGTQNKRLIVPYKTGLATILLWQRIQHAHYYVIQVDTTHTVELSKHVSQPEQYSVIGIVQQHVEESIQQNMPNMQDMSAIQHEDDWPDDDNGDWWTPPIPPSSPRPPPSSPSVPSTSPSSPPSFSPRQGPQPPPPYPPPQPPCPPFMPPPPP